MKIMIFRKRKTATGKAVTDCQNKISSSNVNISGSDAASVGEASTAQPSEEQKPPVLSTKKEPPTYPPGETG